MKAIVVHQYGPPEVLRYEEYPDPAPGPGEVLVRVVAASVNPVDYKRRAGLTTEFYPLKFPGLIGVDVAGTVIRLGPGVEGFSIGDPVFAMADDTYAELCVVKAAILAKVPKGLDLIEAAALPLATTTGNQLLLATKVDVGQTVLVAGAAGNVGRSAVFTAKTRGATVIAGVLRRQIDGAKTIGADQVVATDDDTVIASLPPLDAVADTLADAEREHILDVLKQTDGLIGGQCGAATRLGLPRTTLVYKMRKLGIEARRTHRSRLVQPAGDCFAAERFGAVGSF